MSDYWRVKVYEPFYHEHEADDVVIIDGVLLLMRKGKRAMIISPAIKYRAELITKEEDTDEA